jgi:ATP-binding cassette, subfamily F, member 2
MPPSASKQKRLAEKVNRLFFDFPDTDQSIQQAAKAASKGNQSVSGTNDSGTSTPLGTSTANTSQEDLVKQNLSEMAKLKLATDRSGSGVLTSDPQSRDIHIETYTLSFHGRLLIENASVSLNFGQR